MVRSSSPTSPTVKTRPRDQRPHINHLQLFHHERMQSEETFHAAVEEFSAHVARFPIVDAVLRDLLSGPRLLLEVVLSATDESIFYKFSQFILDTFPTTATAFGASSASSILATLSLSLHFLPCAAQNDKLAECRRAVELAPPVLQALASNAFERASPEEPDDELDSFFKVKGKKGAKSQKQVKRAKKVGRGAMDPRPFDAMGVAVPEDAQEAEALAKEILEDQKGIMERYFLLLRRSDFAEAIRNGYMTRQPTRTTNLGQEKVADVSAACEAAAVAPAAFPMVQPMKAALYFDSAHGFGEWRILISTRADRNLREARKKTPETFRIIIKKIKELSRGQFSDDNQKKLTGHNTDSIDIFEAKMTGDSRLVYQVDCIPDYNSDVERQVIRIFGIYTHAQLDARFWASMGSQLARKGREYQKRCKFRNRPLEKGDYVVLPASWPEPVEQTELQSSANAMPLRPQDLDELHSLLVLEKFVTFSQALLNSIIADHDVAHVFAVSPKEKEIIEHSASCYVLGRSGTGKTTTMLFKILGIERAWEQCRDTMPKPRQIFVTQSRVLAGKVDEYFAKLLHSLSVGSQSREELAKMVRNQEAQARRMVDEDDQENWRSDLPRQFSALEDEHFPLFITFDKLCKLLEADILSDTQKELEDTVQLSPVDGFHRPNSLALSTNATLVSYYRFLQDYWEHFPQSLTKGLDPSLVYSEFMGIVKGSEQTLDHEEGYLDKKSYLALSHRANSTFAAKRELVYSVFQSYVKRKRELGDFDPADRSRIILRHIQTDGLAGRKIDFLYVDEAQDNLLIDALLLRSLCKNPDGLFWAGDTAQTISVGSSFRFNDLKAFLYRVEEKMKQSADYTWHSSNPKAFQLTVNYRSHGGIVNCAHSVIQIISKFWPYAIDDLASEQGIIDGLKPVFFYGWDRDTVRYEQFLFGAAGEHMEFGAQQCILVRDDAARDKLRAEVGDIGLIMTLYESKGLEFNDVLLYNFFEDSTVNLAQWRVVLNMIEKGARGHIAPPNLDDTRHAGVCSELKFLYVAITRARKNMWIVDCSDKGEPLRQFWTYKDLISTCTPGMTVPRLAVQSTVEEWAEQGHSLFRSRRFAQAMHSFERAGLQREMDIASAYHLREKARLLRPGSRHADAELADAYTQAGNAFLKCADAGGHDAQTYYRNAGDCYSRANDTQRAARAFLSAAEYTLAAQHFRKGGMFDEAVDVVQAYREKVEPVFAHTLIDTARVYYLRDQNLEKANPLFSSLEEELEFLDDCGMDIAQATLLESLGRVAEAAEVHLSEGRAQQAIKLLLSDRENPSSVKRAKDCLLDFLWQKLSFGVTSTLRGWDEDRTRELREMLRFSNQLNTVMLETKDIAELAMFDAIFKNDLNRLRDTAQSLLASDKNMGAAILCLDHFYTSPPKIKTASNAEVSSALRLFQEYIRLLKRVATDPNAVENPVLVKLFAIQVVVMRATDEGVFMTPRETSRAINQAIARRLNIRIAQEDEMCRQSRAFSAICLSAAIYHQCNRPDCIRRHIDTPQLSADWYTAQLRVFFQQFVILQMLHSQMLSAARARDRRIWLSKLYEALFPAHHSLGSPSILRLDQIPEASKAVEVIKDWLRELVYSLDPYQHQALFLTFFVQALTIHQVFTPPPSLVPEYVDRAVCMTKPKPSLFLRSPRGDDILRDFCGSISGNHPFSLSQGTLFLQFVLKNHLFIDLSVLCDFLDYLSGSIVIAYRYNAMRTFHDITLPRNWLLRLLPQHNIQHRKDIRPVLLYTMIGYMPSVLDALFSGQSRGGLQFQGKDAACHGLPIRHLFIYRICRALCLMGYNIAEAELRGNIRRAITSIKHSNRRMPDLLARYVEAPDWESLARHARSSDGESPLDEMLWLLHRPMLRTSPPEHRGVRNVYFHKGEEIIPLLISGRSSTLRVEAAPFIPKSLAAAEADGPAVDAENAQLQGDPQFNADGSSEELESASAAVEAISVAQPSVVSQEETSKAVIIQRAYRKAVRRKRGGKHSGLQATRDAFFELCASAASGIDWPDRSQYQLLFLGPVTHALVAADRIHRHAYSAKQKARKQLSKLQDHQELEDARARQTKSNELFRAALNLQKALDPKAEVHRKRDTATLKKHVLALQALADKLPAGSVQEVQEDLAVAIKGIVTPPAPPKKQEKPELVVDDVDDY